MSPIRIGGGVSSTDLFLSDSDFSNRSPRSPGKSNCLACEGLHKDLHATAEMKNYGGVNKKVRDL